MKNYVQHGRTLTVPAPYNLISGDLAIVGAIIGVTNGDAAQGAPADVDVIGVFTLPKVSALAIATGDVVYWDSAAKLVTKTAASNTKIGYAVTDAANPSGVVNVRLTPSV